MHIPRAVGRHAASRKYDLLTALGAWALKAGPGEQRTALRLITLLTARYNWQRDHLQTGQDDIARLWACDVRTVKRELARLRSRGWLVQTRPGARGRVAEHRLGMDRIVADTEAAWASVGPDFAARMGQGGGAADPAESVPVPMPEAPPPPAGQGDEWGQALAVLHRSGDAAYAVWFRRLRRVGRDGAGELVLRAPSAFHADYVETRYATRLLSVLRGLDASVRRLRIIA